MKKKILIVDDDLEMLNLYQAVLKNVFETILATNGREAVDMAGTQLPDLILMDIMLPEMDGLEATRLIRENPKTRSIPILAVTALSSRKDKEKCLQSGCDDYLSKPFTQFTRLQLFSRIEKLLKKSNGNLSTLSPKPTVLFSRLSLIPSELIHVLERETSVRKPKTLLDDLGVEEGAIFQEHVGEGPSISILGSVLFWAIARQQFLGL